MERLAGWRHSGTPLRVLGISLLALGLVLMFLAAAGLMSGPPDVFCPVWNGCSGTYAGLFWQVALLGVGGILSGGGLLTLHRARIRGSAAGRALR